MKEETLKKRIEKLEAKHGCLDKKVNEHKVMYDFVLGNEEYSIADKIELLEREQVAIKRKLGMDASTCTCWTDRGGGNISGINDPNCPFHHPKLGMAGTEPKCLCHFDVNNPIGTERFRIIHKDCPIHSKSNLPLKARVAEALGKECSYITYQGKLGWYYRVPYVKAIRDWYSLIPDYDKHVDLAMGAFWTYLILNYKQGQIEIDERGNGQIIIYSGDLINTLDKFAYHFCNPITAKDFCEAIAKHAEQTGGKDE